MTGSGRRECEKCGGWGVSQSTQPDPLADELSEALMVDLARMLAVPRVMLNARWDEGMDRATVLHVLQGLREAHPETSGWCDVFGEFARTFRGVS